MNKFIIKFDIQKSVFEDSIDPRYYIENLKEIGEVTSEITKENIPDVGEKITDECGFIATVTLKSDISIDLLNEMFEPVLNRGVSIKQEPEVDNDQNINEDEKLSQSLVQGYLVESQDIVTRLNEQIEDITKDPSNREKINSLFREFHTLKGGTGVILSYGQNDTLEMLKNLTQAAEGLLHRARDEGKTLQSEQLELIQSSIDRIDDLLNGFEQEIELDLNETYELLEQYETLGVDIEIKPHKEESSSQDVKLAAVKELLNQYLPMYEMISQKKSYTDEDIKFTVHSFMILEKFKDGLSNEILTLMEDLKQNLEKKDFTSCSKLFNEFNKFLQNISKPIQEKEQEIKEAPKKGVKPQQKTSVLRVEERTINNLMSLVGEVTVFKEWFNFFISKLEKKYEQKEASKELKEQVMRFKNIVESMYDTVLDMRMVPLSTLFERYPKLVRDLSKNLGKKINFKEEGGDILLDKMIIEKIGEPMVHLIRNSIDHGLEDPDRRKTLGKNETGNLKIDAFQKKGKVFIQIIDDGRGIDPQEIKEIAKKKGLISDEKLSTMSEEEIQKLILLPGFSTKQKATEISGRGVGTDAILTAVNDVSGELYLESKKDKGTTVTLELPLTIAMQKLLLFKLSDEIYGIPASLIGEVIKIPKKEVSFYNKLKVFIHRGNAIEIYSLREQLHLENGSFEDELTLLIDSSNKRAYIVDSLLNTIDTVVKPVPPIISNIKEISGVTILGDGTVVYVLNL